MNKKLMIAIPVIAAVLTIGTGAGVIYAKNAEPNASYKPISNYASTAPTASDNTTWVGYCGSSGMMGPGSGQGLVTSQVANLLGTTVADLKTQLDSGKTLSDIATAKGVSQDQLIQTIMALFTDHMSLMLKYDYLTQDQINSMTQQMRARLQTLITSPLNSADENGWGFMQDMMDGDNGGMMNNYGGGMMGGWSNSQVQPGTTAAPNTGFGGMMGGNSRDMMGGWSNSQVQPATPQSPGSTSTPRAGFGGMMGRW